MLFRPQCGRLVHERGVHSEVMRKGGKYRDMEEIGGGWGLETAGHFKMES